MISASWEIKTEVYASENCRHGSSIYSKTRKHLNFGDCFSMVPNDDPLPEPIYPYIAGLKCYLGSGHTFSNKTHECKIVCDSYNSTDNDTDCDGSIEFQHYYSSLHKTCVKVSDHLSYSFTFHGVQCHPSDKFCDEGIKGAGAHHSIVCCPKSCTTSPHITGSCGGDGCSRRHGGAKACCSKDILESKVSCDNSEAPCIVEHSVPDPHCKNGIKDPHSTVCCSKSCGKCGGTGCSLRSGGAIDCCGENIVASRVTCDYSNAPCIIEKEKPSDPQCNKGIKGSGPNHSTVCCTKSCGTCGGTGCSRRSGGAKDCCSRNIFESKVSCDNSMAPCIVKT
jgi:hypothetical protein